MRTSTIFRAVVAPLLFALAGCVPNKVYRQNQPVIAIATTPHLPSDSSDLPPGSPCLLAARAVPANAHDPGVVLPARKLLPYTSALPESAVRPCLAFIEFDEYGQASVMDDKGHPSQIESATALVRKAIEDDPAHQPVILTFVHGWKHNAREEKPEDSNVQGFEETLNTLAKYTYEARPNPSGEEYKGHVVIGIYIAWRGDSISKYWTATRQLSVYNRESAATRVGGATLTDALMRISHLAHPPESAGRSDQPFLVFIGHSFGALVLERALTQAFLHFMDEQRDAKPAAQLPLLADLVVYVNSAAAATQAKPVIDYLASEGVLYQSEEPRRGDPAGTAVKRDYPLFLSVTTSADVATGLLLPVEHYGSGALGKLAGSFRDKDPLSCFNQRDPKVHWSDSTHSQLDFWVKSAPHMDALQSHELLEYTHTGPNRPKSCPVVEDGAFATFGTGGHCYQIEPKNFGGAPACNGTPYWLIETDKTIIPDHGTIFTRRLIDFIATFLPQPGSTGQISTRELTRSAPAR